MIKSIAFYSDGKDIAQIQRDKKYELDVSENEPIHYILLYIKKQNIIIRDRVFQLKSYEFKPTELIYTYRNGPPSEWTYGNPSRISYYWRKQLNQIHKFIRIDSLEKLGFYVTKTPDKWILNCPPDLIAHIENKGIEPPSFDPDNGTVSFIAIAKVDYPTDNPTTYKILDRWKVQVVCGAVPYYLELCLSLKQPFTGDVQKFIHEMFIVNSKNIITQELIIPGRYESQYPKTKVFLDGELLPSMDPEKLTFSAIMEHNCSYFKPHQWLGIRPSERILFENDLVAIFTAQGEELTAEYSKLSSLFDPNTRLNNHRQYLIDKLKDKVNIDLTDMSIDELTSLDRLLKK